MTDQHSTETRTVSTREELTEAVSDGVAHLVVDGTISGITRVSVPAGGSLRGAPGGGRLEANAVAVRLGPDATVEDIEPVRGSGLFLAGHGDEDGLGDGGRLTAESAVTGEIHTDGGIPEETPHLISGGVFVLSGA